MVCTINQYRPKEWSKFKLVDREGGNYKYLAPIMDDSIWLPAMLRTFWLRSSNIACGECSPPRYCLACWEFSNCPAVERVCSECVDPDYSRWFVVLGICVLFAAWIELFFKSDFYFHYIFIFFQFYLKLSPLVLTNDLNRSIFAKLELILHYEFILAPFFVILKPSLESIILWLIFIIIVPAYM
jgi:hypothetical protein